MALADDIINELRKKPGLTATEITVSLFGIRYPYYEHVYRECRRLIEAGHLERRGKGGRRDPFTYHLPHATGWRYAGTAMSAGTRLRKERIHDKWDRYVPPYDPYGPGKTVSDDSFADDGGQRGRRNSQRGR